MKKMLVGTVLAAAASVFAQQTVRQDVPDVQDGFWNTSARRQAPVVVDQCAAVTSLRALETRTGTSSASRAIDDLDSRFRSQSVSNGTDIRNVAPLMILIR